MMEPKCTCSDKTGIVPTAECPMHGKPEKMRTPMDEAIQQLVNMAYQCGHNDAPSLTCPSANEVYGYKTLKGLIDLERQESELREQSLADRINSLIEHNKYLTDKCFNLNKIAQEVELLKAEVERLTEITRYMKLDSAEGKPNPDGSWTIRNLRPYVQIAEEAYLGMVNHNLALVGALKKIESAIGFPYYEKTAISNAVCEGILKDCKEALSTAPSNSGEKESDNA